MKKLILFDIDGTILKYKRFLSKKFISEVIQDIFNREVPEEVMPNFAGMTDLQILVEICNSIDIPTPFLYENIDKIWAQLIIKFESFSNTENIELLQGASELIQMLDSNPDLRLGLLTGNFKANAYLKLRIFGLDSYFPFGAFGSDDQDRNKLPEIAIKRANNFIGEDCFSEENTILIGDSPRDIECAKSNNLPICCVATGTFNYDKLSEYAPDIILSSFENYEAAYNTIMELFKN